MRVRLPGANECVPYPHASDRSPGPGGMNRRDVVQDEGAGIRLQERFAGIRLEDDLPELRGQVAKPATFERKGAEQERPFSRRPRG